jgi:hypothetical protein
MNTGQVMLILGAFAVLSILSLSLNRTMFGSSQLGYELEATLNALSIGQSMLDEILTKSFDQKTTAGKIAYNVSQVTPYGSLGPESGEAITGFDSAYTSGGIFHDFQSKSQFNDADDYHLYRRRVFDPRMGYFEVIDSIFYVSEYAPAKDTTSATFYKKIVVVVTHPSLPKAKDTDTTVAPIIVRDIAVYRQYF